MGKSVPRGNREFGIKAMLRKGVYAYGMICKDNR